MNQISSSTVGRERYVRVPVFAFIRNVNGRKQWLDVPPVTGEKSAATMLAEYRRLSMFKVAMSQVGERMLTPAQIQSMRIS